MQRAAIKEVTTIEQWLHQGRGVVKICVCVCVCVEIIHAAETAGWHGSVLAQSETASWWQSAGRQQRSEVHPPVSLPLCCASYPLRCLPAKINTMPICCKFHMSKRRRKIRWYDSLCSPHFWLKEKEKLSAESTQSAPQLSTTQHLTNTGKGLRNHKITDLKCAGLRALQQYNFF